VSCDDAVTNINQGVNTTWPIFLTPHWATQNTCKLCWRDPSLKKQEPIKQEPINCVCAYGVWGICSKTCGTSSQSATYKISTAAANGGKACAAADGGKACAAADKITKTQTCSKQDCPCDGSACKNSGKCTDEGGKASCACAAGFGGATCATAVACPTNAAGSPCKCKTGYRSNHADKATVSWDTTKQVYTSVGVVDNPCSAQQDYCHKLAVCSSTCGGTHTCVCTTGNFGTGQQCTAWKTCGRLQGGDEGAQRHG